MYLFVHAGHVLFSKVMRIEHTHTLQYRDGRYDRGINGIQPHKSTTN